MLGGCGIDEITRVALGGRSGRPGYADRFDLMKHYTNVNLCVIGYRYFRPDRVSTFSVGSG